MALCDKEKQLRTMPRGVCCGVCAQSLHSGLNYVGYECIPGLYADEAIALLKAFYDQVSEEL
jgi:hypothetical protein